MTPYQLTLEDRKNISKWADCERLSFTRLYKASADGGCNASTFHKKCDGKGPTVTVAYNNTGYVFGAYASESFTSNNNWTTDKSMFLFQLRESGNVSYYKYPASTYPGIYNHTSYGPSFGSTQGTEEFRFFSGDNPVGNGGVIASNNILVNLAGDGFLATNLTWLKLGGNNANFLDLEVYKVEVVNLLAEDQPWRKMKLGWNTETRDILKQEIADYQPDSSVDVPRANILMIGQIGAGKSSFFNTVNSVFQGDITAQAVAGSSNHSLTTRYRTYRPRLQRGRNTLNFQLCDTMGLEEDSGIELSDFSHILTGSVPDNFQFSPGSSIANDNRELKKDVKLRDKIHVAAFVVDGSNIQVMSMTVLNKLKEIKKLVDRYSIPTIVILTKVDKVCCFVADDLTTIYHSADVRNCVDEIAEKLGTPRSQILPVKNYDNENDVEESTDIITLLVLKRMLRLADNFFDNQIDLLGLSESPAKEEATFTRNVGSLFTLPIQ